jgi:hypothetical protein
MNFIKYDFGNVEKGRIVVVIISMILLNLKHSF